MHFLLFSSLAEWNKLQAGEFYFIEAFLLENKMKAVPQIQPQVSSLGKGQCLIMLLWDLMGRVAVPVR